MKNAARRFLNLCRSRLIGILSLMRSGTAGASRQRGEQRRSAAPAAGLILLLTALLAAARALSIRFYGAFCPSVLLLGLPCPVCGMTRAALLLLQGRPLDSLRMHPLLLPLLFFGLWYAFRRFPSGAKLRHPRLILAGWCILFLLVYALRMIRFFPGNPPMSFTYESAASHWIPEYNKRILQLMHRILQLFR